MRATPTLLAMGLSTAVAVCAGCRTPPPPRVQIPVNSGGNDYTTYQHDAVKPLPPSAKQPEQESPQQGRAPQPPIQAPAVSQAYLESYDRVGRPRLLVLVDRANPPARSIVPGDYETLERVVRDALAAEGQVAIVPPSAARQLNEQQLRGVASGDVKAIADAGNLLHADVVVQVRVAPSSAEREETQITATARNARDGQQIATAAAPIPPPPQRRQIDFAGRLLGERLVDELAGAWDNLSRIPPDAAATKPGLVPATQPERPGLTG